MINLEIKKKVVCMFIPPLKYPKKIPEVLFYHKRTGPKGAKFPYDLYNMLSTKKGTKNGFMVLQATETPVENYCSGRSLRINFIISAPQYNGYGQKMIDLVKNISKKGYNGHIQLKADGSYTPNKIPHLFYRKNGFSTLDKKLDAKMDMFLKWGKDATTKDFPDVMMYYPAPEKYPPQNEYRLSLFERLRNLFRKLF